MVVATISLTGGMVLATISLTGGMVLTTISLIGSMVLATMVLAIMVLATISLIGGMVLTIYNLDLSYVHHCLDLRILFIVIELLITVGIHLTWTSVLEPPVSVDLDEPVWHDAGTIGHHLKQPDVNRTIFGVSIHGEGLKVLVLRIFTDIHQQILVPFGVAQLVGDEVVDHLLILYVWSHHVLVALLQGTGLPVPVFLLD